MRKFSWDQAFGWLGLALLAVGTYMGLFVAPPERYMGEVQRIMYVHVPCAWVGMVCYTFAFVMAIVSLWTHRPRHDAMVTGAIEVGIVLNALLLIQGSIWARATWGVWWDWDVRLTTSLVMLLLFAGVLALRSFVDDPSQRATWEPLAPWFPPPGRERRQRQALRPLHRFALRGRSRKPWHPRHAESREVRP